jgi:DNA-binding transcriptional LysR family regulator
MAVASVELAAEICAAGELLAVLPDVVAQRHIAVGAALTRLPLKLARGADVYAVWRMQLGLPGRAEALLEALQARWPRA